MNIHQRSSKAEVSGLGEISFLASTQHWLGGKGRRGARVLRDEGSNSRGTAWVAEGVGGVPRGTGGEVEWGGSEGEGSKEHSWGGRMGFYTRYGRGMVDAPLMMAATMVHGSFCNPTGVGPMVCRNISPVQTPIHQIVAVPTRVQEVHVLWCNV